MLKNTYSQGFTLIELLLSLFLTALMVTGVAQYLLISSRVHLTLHQEALASRTLESFLLQASFNQQSKETLETVFSSNSCPSGLTAIKLDFTHWCQALEKLPSLKTNADSTSLSIEWQAPNGKKIIRRPPFQ